MKVKRRRFFLYVDRALSHSVLRQTGILAVMFLVALVLSYGFLSMSGCDWREFCESKNLSVWLLPIYLLLDANALNALYFGNVHGWMLFASSITSILGILIFNGMIIGVITNAIDRRIESHRNGQIHYLKSGHHIIMGYDDMVPSIISEIFAREKDTYVLLLASESANIIVDNLKLSVAKDQLSRIIVNFGYRTDMDCYADIHLESATDIYVVGNRHDPAHDALNVECIDSIERYLKDGNFQRVPSRITCVFEDFDTYEAFKTSEIFNGLEDLNIDFIPYNFYEGWARQVFVQRKYREKCNPDKELDYPSVYGNGILPDEKRHVHIVFVGITNLSVAFAKEAAHLLHFPNFEHDNAMKTRITFIDVNADKGMPLFIARNRHFFEVQPYIYRDFSEGCTSITDESLRREQLSQKINDTGFLDVEFEFIKGDVFSKQVQDEICRWATDKESQSLSIFVTMTDQRRNFITGMNMPDEVYDNDIPVFIRQDRADSFVTKLREVNVTAKPYNTIINGMLVEGERKGRYSNVYPFGMNDLAYCNEEYAYRQAKLVNLLYCKADYSKYIFPDLKDLELQKDEDIWADANREWKRLTIALRWSNLYCTYNFVCKLAVLRAMRGLSPDDTSRDMDEVSDMEMAELAAAEHNRWNVEKLLMGYRKASDVGIVEDKYACREYCGDLQKNKKIFIHHDIRPYKDLDEVWKLDYEIVKYMPWILKMAGRRI